MYFLSLNLKRKAMKKILIILFFLPLLSFGQWTNVYNNWYDIRTVNGVLETSDAGCLIGGNNFSSYYVPQSQHNYQYGYGYDIIKTDEYGVKEWGYSVWDGGAYPNSEYIWKVSNTIDGNIIIFYDSGIKILDLYGNQILNKNYPFYYDAIYFDNYGDIDLTLDSGYIFLYKREFYIPSPFNIYYEPSLIKFNSNLDIDFQIALSNSSSVVQAHDSSFVIVGESDSNLVIQKRGFTGDSLWTRIYNSPGTFQVGDIIKTVDSNLVIIGSESGDISFFKINVNGDTLFTNSIDKQDGLLASSVVETSNGNFAIIGTAYINNVESNIYLVLVDTLGNLIWDKKYGLANIKTKGINIENSTGGGFIISGLRNNKRMILMKTDANGVTAVNDVDKEMSKGNLLKIVDVLGRETNAVSNTPLFYIYENGTVEKRIIIE